MSILAAAVVGGFTAWLVDWATNKDLEEDFKRMYEDKYGAEWDNKVLSEPQSMVQWALGYGEEPSLYYNEAESEVISGERRGKVVSTIGSDPRLRKLTKDIDITPEAAMLRREISAEQFAVEFDDWAEQEMKTHGYNISFREWAEEEGQSHGDEELLDWAQHEEESHEARYDAEDRVTTMTNKTEQARHKILKMLGESHLNMDGNSIEGYGENDSSLKHYPVVNHSSNKPITYQTLVRMLKESFSRGWAEGLKDAYYAGRMGFDAESNDVKCDICGGHEQVGYVDDDLSLKVCEHCDIDGADYDPKLWEAESYKPPASAVANAKRGLTLRKEFGRGGLSPSEAKAQGIDSGVTRARKIASGKVSRHDVRRMSAFNRHRKNNNPSKKMPDGGPTAGTIAWLLWGGTSGVNWAKNKSASMNAETMVKQVCLFCENDDSEEGLVEIMLDGYPEMICESCMDPNNWAAESFGPVDEDGILAKALAKARAKSREPRQPLKITKLPHRDQKSLKDFEEFNSTIVYDKPKGVIAQVMAKEKALQQVALSEALLELEQYIRLGMITEEEAFRKIVQMSR